MANKKSKMLLVEDDLDLAELLQDYYTVRGYEISHYTDPTAALAELRSQIGEAQVYDLVLTDLMLPNMDGLSFTKKVKELLPQVPIVVSTSDGRIETALQAIEIGAFDFIVKPIHFPQLNVTLERALHFNKLQKDNRVLRESVRNQWSNGGIVGRSAAIKSVVDLTQRVARTAATVLIQGESGTGKELIARLVHNQSPRKKEPFIAINCSAIPENLLESELFGFAKGAFTGAQDKRIGLFEEANGGTLFLDEIGDLPLPLQAKLLRVLQEKTIKRLGENQSRPVDVRIVAATHKNLEVEAREKRFREDLFFRLNVIPIKLPPLRDRPEDILPLAEHFLKRANAQNGLSIRGFTKPALELLLQAKWPGNIRELENTIERAAILCQETEIGPVDLPSLSMRGGEPAAPSAPLSTEALIAQANPVIAQAPAAAQPILKSLSTQFPDQTYPSLRELEQAYIPWVLERMDGVKDRAAKVLGVDRKTLYRKLAEIDRKAAVGEAVN